MIPFLAGIDQSELFPLIVVVMAMSIPIIAIITEHMQKQQRMRLTEKAIEHGVDLSALEIKNEKSGPRLPYRSGMVCVAIGIALLAGDHYTDFDFAGLYLPLRIGGLVVGAIGVALLLNDLVNRNRFDDRT